MYFLLELLPQNLQHSERLSTEQTKNPSQRSNLSLWGGTKHQTCKDVCTAWSGVLNKCSGHFQMHLWIVCYSIAGWKAKKPLSMPTQMLQYQLRQAMHDCCSPVPLSQLPQAPTVLEHGDTWSPARPSRTSSRDNSKYGSASWLLSETA